MTRTAAFILLAALAALGGLASGCSPEPAASDDMTAETRRWAEQMQNRVYLPAAAKNPGRRKVFVKITAVDMAAASQKRPHEWGLSITVLEGGLPEGARVLKSKSFILEPGATGRYGGFEFSAKATSSGVRLVFSPGAQGAARDLSIEIPRGKAALVALSAGSGPKPLAMGFLSVLTGKSTPCVIEARPTR